MATGMASIEEKDSGDQPTYQSYLQLDKVLTAQLPLSKEIGGIEAHDEMLFICSHQTYELWFKLILHEINSCIEMFQVTPLLDEELMTIVSRLRRVTVIQKVLNDQFAVLETMTPLDFMDFRKYLGDSSGFQSCQFRMFEIKLGLKHENRIKYASKDYMCALRDDQVKICLEAESSNSLFDCVEKWLERTPFVNYQNFDFFENYHQAVERMLSDHEAEIKSDRNLSANEKRDSIDSDIEHERQRFAELFSEEQHIKLVERKRRRFCHKAYKAALLIELYKEQPLFQMPYQLLNVLRDIEELLGAWRNKHAEMVLRMLGRKKGSGGSSGYDFLRSTMTFHRIFSDLFNMASFILPRTRLPELPQDVLEGLKFAKVKKQSGRKKA
eukprot:979532_1